MFQRFRIVALALALTGGLLALAGQPATAAGEQPVDTTAPVLNFMPHKAVVGSTLSDSTTSPIVSTQITWSTYDAGGICSQSAAWKKGYYDPWTSVPLTAGQRSFTMPVSLGSYPYVQVTVRDCAGNSKTRNYYPSWELIQEGSATLSPGWTTSNCKCWSGGAVVHNSRAGAKASYSFY